MTAATLRDETLELRLKGLGLGSFGKHYLELAEQAALEGWHHIRYLGNRIGCGGRFGFRRIRGGCSFGSRRFSRFVQRFGTHFRSSC